MKSVADSINENQRQIIEYGRNVTTYYASALSSLTSLSNSSLGKASNLIDRNIKTLSEGGLNGLKFSFAPSVPLSAVEKQREENQTLQDEMLSQPRDSQGCSTQQSSYPLRNTRFQQNEPPALPFYGMSAQNIPYCACRNTYRAYP